MTTKASTIKQLLHADIVQSSALMSRYIKSSSLSRLERQENRPNVCQYRRDRVLHHLMKLNGESLVNTLVMRSDD